MQVSKWGNSLAIRLPASVVEALKIHEGDDIEVVIADERVFKVKKKPGECKTLYSEDMQDGLLIDNQLRICNPFTIHRSTED